jgi:hypothetical protein
VAVPWVDSTGAGTISAVTSVGVEVSAEAVVSVVAEAVSVVVEATATGEEPVLVVIYFRRSKRSWITASTVTVRACSMLHL